MGSERIKISVILSTYNERDNLKAMVEGIDDTLRKAYEIILVDDNSPDNTFELAQQLAEDYPINPLKRSGKFGLASAIVYGFDHASGDILVVLDADLQHPPGLMRELVRLIAEGYDITVASRYLRGREIKNWSKSRGLISKVAYILARPLVNITDPMSGYFCLRREVIDGLKFNAVGFKILLEILVKSKYRKIKEVPYTFGARQDGKSKFNYQEVFKYLWLLTSLYGYRLRGK